VGVGATVGVGLGLAITVGIGERVGVAEGALHAAISTRRAIAGFVALRKVGAVPSRRLGPLALLLVINRHLGHLHRNPAAGHQ
jgi:hypothetical protein